MCLSPFLLLEDEDWLEDLLSFLFLVWLLVWLKVELSLGMSGRGRSTKAVAASLLQLKRNLSVGQQPKISNWSANVCFKKSKIEKQ